jgi:hypothetical protein
MLIGSRNAIIAGSAKGVASKLDLAKTFEGSFIEKARATLGLE